MVIWQSCPVKDGPLASGVLLIGGPHIHRGWEGVRLMADSVEFFDEQGHLLGIVFR